MLFKTTCWINNQNLAAEKKSPVMISREKLKSGNVNNKKNYKKKPNQKSQAFHPLTTKNTNITQT